MHALHAGRVCGHVQGCPWCMGGFGISKGPAGRDFLSNAHLQPLHVLWNPFLRKLVYICNVVNKKLGRLELNV